VKKHVPSLYTIGNTMHALVTTVFVILSIASTIPAVVRDHLDESRTTGVRYDRSVCTSGTSVRLQMVGLDTARWQYGPVACHAGELYVFSADIRTLLLRTAGLKMYVNWRDAGGNITESKVSDWIGGSTDWTRRYLVVRAPADTASAVIGCRLTRATRWGGQPKNEERVAWIDRITWGTTPDVVITGPATQNVVRVGDKVAFDLRIAEGPVPTTIEAELVNAWGHTLARRRWTPRWTGEQWSFDFGALGPGYYEVRWRITAPEGHANRTEVSSVAVLRPKTPVGKRNAIAVDGAFSWAYKDSARLRTAVHLAKELGVACIRDRYSWAHVSRKRGLFDPSRYQLAADLQHAAGIEVFSIFQRSPAWSSNAPKGLRRSIKVRYMPRDPGDVYEAMRQSATHFRGQVQYWEIWNEADLPSYFIGRPDEYAAIAKAAYLGAKAGNPDVAVLTCSFTGINPDWAERVIENGALDYADIYNFHYYGRPWRIAKSIDQHKALMSRKLPMWMSENGERSSSDVHGSPLAGEMRVSRYLVDAAVRTLAEGVDRHFWFAFPPIWERAAGPWGIVRADITPTPSYVTLAVLREMLGDGRCLGEVKLGPGRANGMLFASDGGRAVLVAFPESETYLRIHGATGDTRVVDIVGNEEIMPWSADTSGVLHMRTTGSAFFVTNLLRDAFEVTPARNWPRFDPDSLADPKARQVWAFIDVHGSERDLKPRKIKKPLMAVHVPEGMTRLPFDIVVYNMSAKAARVRMNLGTDGIAVEGDSVVVVTVPAGGKTRHSGALLTGGMKLGRDYTLRLTGSRSGHALSPVVVYFKRVRK
jgi:hypothetical protein